MTVVDTYSEDQLSARSFRQPDRVAALEGHDLRVLPQHDDRPLRLGLLRDLECPLQASVRCLRAERRSLQDLDDLLMAAPELRKSTRRLRRRWLRLSRGSNQPTTDVSGVFRGANSGCCFCGVTGGPNNIGLPIGASATPGWAWSHLPQVGRHQCANTYMPMACPRRTHSHPTTMQMKKILSTTLLMRIPMQILWRGLR